MNDLITIFANNLLPILLSAFAGFALNKVLQLEARTVSRITFYLFSPFLVFNLITTSNLENGAILKMASYALTITIVVGLLTFALGKLMKFERKVLAAVVIASMFTNAGNFGLSLNLFTFGEEALSYASIYFVISGFTIYTFGAFIASMGKSDIRTSLIGLLKLPTLYALAIAIVARWINLDFPVFIDRTIDTMADGAIPSMLILLGMQLGNTNLKGNLRALGLINGIRLVAAPLIAIAFASLFNLEGSAYNAGILEASTPTAVMTTVLATEFDIEPGLVTTAVTTTTILSPLMLSPLIIFLGG